MTVHEIDAAEAGDAQSAIYPVDEKHPAEKTAFDSSEEIIDSADKIYVPGEDEEFIDPRLKDYPIPLVAKTVDLHNDFSEPILTFRFFLLSTFWVLVGDAISTMYYFKPYSNTLTSYAVQLLSWGMGDFLGRVLPKRSFHILGRSFSLNPGPWNAKEHALIVVAYWGSCYTAYGLGPLSALELYYDRKINAGWGIMFLLTSQMIGYGFAGLFRDILVRPPKMYYPGVLPNVALLNAMHRNPTVTKKSLKFFAYVSCITFVYQFFPGVIFPMLSSLPLLCYMAHGKWKGFVLGSGYYGYGLLDISLDWNYIGFFSPLYTPLWANASMIGGALMASWMIYPIMYFTNTLNALTFPPMSSGTFDQDGQRYNVSRVLTPNYRLNQTAMDEYSRPHWAPSYAMYFFWGFACSTGAIVYSVLWYGKSSYTAIVDAFKGRRTDYNDPYIQLMSRTKRVPHWWYIVLLVVCVALSLGTLYGGDFGLPWWGFIVICIVSAISTFPNGILWGIANQQVGMAFLSELMAGAMFPGNPSAVLASMTFGRQILEQNLNLISDYKFGFYMKIPEKEMFWGQVYGTLLGPFVNYGFMRLIIDRVGKSVLTGRQESNSWLALKTKNYYSLSVLWGVLGPKVIFANDSQYNWIYYAFLIGPALVGMVYIVHRYKPHWEMETRCNPVVIMCGAFTSPLYETVNIFTSGLAAFFFMGYMFRYRPVWFRKYNYLLGVGLDCGTQLCQTVIMLAINLTNSEFPQWWGNDGAYFDRCYPPSNLPANALN
ncbi:isp4 protein [Grosmannia clavigera kw1407]|uniref:Isp4 protein n=1 Tax=Grosmannia clavigera (strain kw1407 / UAMH 11150) TaxID=655863 RepID=F0XEA9_GROCL|nr:isp4 protein [Grosmannia clavigera kw1407]EFX04527.1 isp4 protein [Grosmannia clavigera kw1407]